MKPVFGLVKNVEQENLEGSNPEDSCFSKTTFFVVDEQPFFMAGSWLFSLTSNHFNLYIRDGFVFVKMYTKKKEINTPSYLCVDVGQIRPNHLKSLCS